MVQLQSDDKQSWDYLKDNYSVSKSAITITPIGLDHAMEKSNKKKKKVREGIIGITQNTAALHHFTSFLLNGTPSEFNFRSILYKFQITAADVKNQLTGSHL